MRYTKSIAPILLLVLPGCFLEGRMDPMDHLAAETALAVVKSLSEGEFARAHAHFNPDVDFIPSIEELTVNWVSTVNDLGEYQGISSFFVRATNIRATKANTVVLECEFARGTASIVMEVAEDGRVVDYGGPIAPNVNVPGIQGQSAPDRAKPELETP